MKQIAHKPTERVLNILELLSNNPEGLTLTEIAETIQSPKSTIYPIIQTMLERQFIKLEKSSLKYTIGISAFFIGSSYLRNEYVLEFVKKEMQTIVSQIDETCQMGILDHGQVLYVLKEEPKKDMDIRIVSYVGKRLPAYCTALGKALLHNYDIEEIKMLYPNGLKPMTKNTITDFNILEEQLKEIRKGQIASETEETTEYLCCFAVPLVSKNKTIAALSISIPTFRATEDKINQAIQLLQKAKKKIDHFFTKMNIEKLTNM